jgi:type IV secretion system protein VirD4
MGTPAIILLALSPLVLILVLHLLRFEARLHTARFARLWELRHLLSFTPRSHGLLLGRLRLLNCFVSVTARPDRRELGNLLIVGPTRSGKGLLAISQLLTWEHSAIINDIKGELFAATAGYRTTIGEVFVLDPTGVGHSYDPLLGKTTEDELYSIATSLLFHPNEGEGAIFTLRAIGMLTQMLLAARREDVPPFLYVRHLIRCGLTTAAARLNSVDPQIATQFLDVPFAQADFSDRFLLSAWSSLTARMRPLLTETVIRSFTRSDFQAGQLLQSHRPISVYLRWREQDLLALSPLVRLLWGRLIDELITTYDTTAGKSCQPVLMLIDEAGRTAIPSLADHSTTVVGRGISLWVAIQSLAQLEAVYGKARAQILRDNMDSQIFYRPMDLATAAYLEDRMGSRSAYARSTTEREGAQTSEGHAEKPIPLLTAQHILQLRDHQIIGFHRRLAPVRMNRVDWRCHKTLVQRKNLPAPELPILPKITEIQATLQSPNGLAQFIDPDAASSTRA